MPLSSFSRFYGIESGKAKAGRLDQFADGTVVLPVRNKDYGYISKINLRRDIGRRGWLYVRNPFQALKYGLPLVSYYPPGHGNRSVRDGREFDGNVVQLYCPT